MYAQSTITYNTKEAWLLLCFKWFFLDKLINFIKINTVYLINTTSANAQEEKKQRP